jgi:pyruvate/2-oxoglutarate dehydrogenase complex dihydrolipoamide dehydrogenase (E3) component
VELALDLARAGRDVRLLDPGEKFIPAPYIGSRAGWVMRWAGQVGLAPETGVTLEEALPGKLAVSHEDGRAEEIACAAVVLAPGRASYDPFGRALLGTTIDVQVIGDARKPRSYGNAIHEAAYLSRRI